jgi:hypothetical protein
VGVVKEAARLEFPTFGNVLGSHYASFSHLAAVGAGLQSTLSIGNSILASKHLSTPAYFKHQDVFSTFDAVTKHFHATRQRIEAFSHVAEIAAGLQSTVSIGNSISASKYLSTPAYFKHQDVFSTFDAVTKHFQATRQRIEAFSHVAEIAAGLQSTLPIWDSILPGKYFSEPAYFHHLETFSKAHEIAYQVSRQAFEVFEGCRSLMDGLLQFEETITKKAEKLGSFGWTVPLDAEISDCIRLLEQSSDSETADAAFTAFYNADERAAYLALKEKLLAEAELATWREDLITAFARFEDDDYLSCVSVLVPRVEGFAATKGNEPRFYTRGARERFFAKKLNGVAKSPLNAALWCSVRAFVDRLYEPVDFADEVQLSNRLNRHTCVHGRGNYKHTQADCLRLLQALDTLSSL